MKTISVIVPMLNEESSIGATVEAIRTAGVQEIIVVDGGSTDRSIEIARGYVDMVLTSSRGRAWQMNAGAAAARGDVLAFVHADTVVPPSFAHDIETGLADNMTVGGRFDVKLDDNALAHRLLGRLISIRSRLMRSATGDQAIFVRRHIFEQLGGFPEMQICEDVDFVRRLRRRGRIACLRSCVVTSARRWRQNGLLRTVLGMWLIKSLFLLGIPGGWLARRYADVRERAIG